MRLNRIGSRAFVAMALIVAIAPFALVVGQQRFHDSGEQSVATVARYSGSAIVVVDGDTVKTGGLNYRLVGFDTPERGDRALCDKERELAEVAAARLRTLLASGEPQLERVACACKTGTEVRTRATSGDPAPARVNGKEVGEILIREGLALPFVCRRTSCRRASRGLDHSRTTRTRQRVRQRRAPL